MVLTDCMGEKANMKDLGMSVLCAAMYRKLPDQSTMRVALAGEPHSLT